MNQPAPQTVFAAPDAAISRHIAEKLAAIHYADLPDRVREVVRLFTLDTLGVIAGAAKAPGMAELLTALTAWESDGKATLLLNGARANPATAALANGAAAHSLDFDDQHDPARVHVFCVILPAVLAAIEAEDRPVSGEEMITALAVGVEVFCRLGLTCYNSLGKGWHPTTAVGSISAAAAASVIFRLDADGFLNAMGLAFVQLSGTTQFIADGALAKRVGPGFAARSGVLAAHLARGGITGPHRYLEGNAGLFTLYERGEVRPEILTEGLGESWQLLDLSMKPWPCCRCTHTAIQLALELNASGLRAGQVASAEIRMGAVNHRIVGADFNPDHPNPVVHAQFNAAYAFATALEAGEVSIASFTPARIRGAGAGIAMRCRTVIDEAIGSTEIAPAGVRVTLLDGTIRDVFSPVMRGSPEDPMSQEAVIAKFRSCLSWGFGAEGAGVDRLIDMIRSLETAPDCSDLIALFRTV
ncbi:MmgE/PrpD family protein [Pseudogemmobacter sonorensis]|uniref:MmgE/PrpD family protein n=1 Tax=Pseudogemmobacter sonorensis TaxID=2989681 RepID=UPI00368B802A